MSKTAIEKACEILKSQRALARAIGVTDAAISQWLEKGVAPEGRALDIEEATKGKVTVKELLSEARAIKQK